MRRAREVRQQDKTLQGLQQREEEFTYLNAALHEIFFSGTGALSAAVEAKDPFPRGHSSRVAKIAVAIVRELGLPEEEMDGICIAGLLHDIGKIGIPSQILMKPKALAGSEKTLIKTHPDIAAEIIKDIPFPWEVKLAIEQHHERYDGKGYPKGLKGENISLGGRLLAVADALETMTSLRPFRAALPLERAIEEIKKGAGSQFDPAVVEALLRLLDKGGERAILP